MERALVESTRNDANKRALVDAAVDSLFEVIFEVTPHPQLDARERLAAKCGIPEQEICTWFEQRRVQKVQLDQLDDALRLMTPATNETTLSPDTLRLWIEESGADENVDCGASAKEYSEATKGVDQKQPSSAPINVRARSTSVGLHAAPATTTPHTHELPFTSGSDLTLHLEDMLAFEDYEEALGSLTTDVDIALTARALGDQPQHIFQNLCDDDGKEGWACDSHWKLPGQQCGGQQSTSSLLSSQLSTHTCTVRDEELGALHGLGEEKVEPVQPYGLIGRVKWMPFESHEVLPTLNVARVLAEQIPRSAKVAKDSKKYAQQAISEFMAFVITEAADIAYQRHHKKSTITTCEIKEALVKLGVRARNVPPSLVPLPPPSHELPPAFLTTWGHCTPVHPRRITLAVQCTQAWEC